MGKKEEGILEDIIGIVRRWLHRGRALTNAEIGNAVLTQFQLVKLQWGRALTNAEMTAMEATYFYCEGLQWGRALTNAEMRAIIFMRSSMRRASMGPRSYERGNFRWSSFTTPEAKLQWDRALTNAEIIA